MDLVKDDMQRDGVTEEDADDLLWQALKAEKDKNGKRTRGRVICSATLTLLVRCKGGKFCMQLFTLVLKHSYSF